MINSNLKRLGYICSFRFAKLKVYSNKSGKSVKRILEDYIDTLPSEEKS